MDAVIIASHLPGEGHFRSAAYDVRPVLCADPFDYWRGLAAVWDDPLTIINVEHDMEITYDHVAELLRCEHPLCSWAYESHWFTTHLDRDVISAANDGSYITEGTEWAEKSAIGLVKITPQARIGSLAEAPWNRLEISIERAVTRPWHMHWPVVPHHHW